MGGIPNPKNQTPGPQLADPPGGDNANFPDKATLQRFRRGQPNESWITNPPNWKSPADDATDAN